MRLLNAAHTEPHGGWFLRNPPFPVGLITFRNVLMDILVKCTYLFYKMLLRTGQSVAFTIYHGCPVLAIYRFL
jgi:hypothetical protein